MKRAAAPSASVRVAAAIAPLKARWQALSPRERHLSTLALSAVGILLVWAIFLAPALSSLQKVQVRRLALDAQTQQMLMLKAEAQLLASQPKIGRDAAVRALQESVTAMGDHAQMQVSGERAVVTLRAAPVASVAAWLGQARTNARVAPVEMRLVRTPVRVAPATPRAAATIPANSANPAAAIAASVAAAAAAAASAAAGNLPPSSQAVAPTAESRPLTNDDIRWDGTMVLVLPAS
ncbi:type II secretion system protein GspM [Xylophilus sp. GOD-11R]|uniref:type II secretion system protein GspM n=1 Tax=Xylophilus sp. GOD-11R TaxID=3089814 RepID=UPI00298D1FCD|nr:type II secretion system protein GspM [Xylophilus sp. GOD-11R]WPB57493.1 type II secretion system protein GspM [Xylophilus sp. GOD-11R]